MCRRTPTRSRGSFVTDEEAAVEVVGRVGARNSYTLWAIGTAPPAANSPSAANSDHAYASRACPSGCAWSDGAGRPFGLRRPVPGGKPGIHPGIHRARRWARGWKALAEQPATREAAP